MPSPPDTGDDARFPAHIAANYRFPDRNQLLADLPTRDRAELLEIAHPFQFTAGDVFCEPGDPTGCVEFIDEGVVSCVVVMNDGRTVECFMVGREGATHPLVRGGEGRCHSQLVAQISGAGRRIRASHLAVFLERRPALGESLRRYAARLMSELEQSAACNALHRTEKRFAKWLLRAHDRIDGDLLLLTQDYLANMLGTQRTTVNEAARELQDQGAIEYRRGRILIVNRGLLEQAACECYGAQAGLLDNVLTTKPLGQ